MPRCDDEEHSPERRRGETSSNILEASQQEQEREVEAQQQQDLRQRRQHAMDRRTRILRENQEQARRHNNILDLRNHVDHRRFAPYQTNTGYTNSRRWNDADNML